MQHNCSKNAPHLTEGILSGDRLGFTSIYLLSWQKCGVCGADGAGVEFGAIANAKVHYMGRAHKKATKLWLDKWALANRR